MNVNNTIDQLAPSGLAYWLFLFFSYYTKGAPSSYTG